MTRRIEGELAWRRGLSIGEQEGEGAAEAPPVPPPSEAATHDLPSGRIGTESASEGERRRERKRGKEEEMSNTVCPRPPCPRQP